MQMTKSIFYLWVSLLGLSLLPKQGQAQDMNAKLVYDRSIKGVAYLEISNVWGQPQSLGSGFIVDEKKGYLITNYHVIEDASGNADRIKVEFKDQKRKYNCLNIIDYDEKLDLALIQIQTGSYKALPLAHHNPSTASKVAAIGSPHGSKFSITEGTVSKENIDPQDVEVLMGERHKSAAHLFQLTAPLNPGNSGGPIFNRNGLVVGVVVAGRIESQNLNFAIKVGNLRAFLRKNNILPKNQESITDIELLAPNRPLSASEKAELEALRAREIRLQDSLMEADYQNKRQTQALEHETALKQAELKKQAQITEAEIEKERSAERARLEKEREAQRLQNEKEREKLNAEQQRQIDAQRARQLLEREASQHDLEQQRLKETKAREWLKLEQEQLALRNAQDMQRVNRKKYYENLLPRISTRVGLGLAAPLWAVASPNNYDWSNLNKPENFAYFAELYLGYRLDLARTWSSHGRGTSFGLTSRLELLPAGAMQNWQAMQNLGQGQNDWGLCRALEFSLVLREWLRLGFGRAWQDLNAVQGGPSSWTYYTANLGFLMRFGAVELDLGTQLGLGGDLAYAIWRPSLALHYHVCWGKW